MQMTTGIQPYTSPTSPASPLRDVVPCANISLGTLAILPAPVAEALIRAVCGRRMGLVVKHVGK